MDRAPISRRLAPVAVTLAVLLAACARNDGRTLQPPAAGATTPPPTSAAAADTAGGAPNSPTFVLSSPAFAAGAAIPVDFTCDGAGSPPPLSWTEPPSSAVELTMVLTDADDGAVPGTGEDVRWVVAGLPPDAGQLLSGSPLPPGAVDLGYQPPCPDPGAPAHVYVFTLYALPSPLGVDLSSTPEEVVTALAGVPAQAAQLTGFYRR